MSDLISRQKVMWMLTNLSYTQCKTQGEADVIETAKTLVITMPSAQPEITLESAIDYLHSIGWMQEHDRILSSAQPEIIHCKDCKWGDWYTSADGKRYCYCMETGNGGRTENDYCSYAERRTDEQTVSE